MLGRERWRRGAPLVNWLIDGEDVAHDDKVDLPAERGGQVDAVQAKESREQREAVLHQVGVVLWQCRNQEGRLACDASGREPVSQGRTESGRSVPRQGYSTQQRLGRVGLEYCG